MAKASRATNDCSIGKYAHKEIARVYKEVGTSPNGLSRRQVERMREKHGANSFTRRNNDTVMWRVCAVRLSIHSMSSSSFSAWSRW